MDNVMLEKIQDLLARNENIGIAVGKNPGIDEMAAALSLYLALSGVGKKVTVASPTEPIVEVSSLVGIDKVKMGFEGNSGSGDLTVSFPYKEGEIEKISYTLEEGKLNILVKAGENGLSFREQDIEFKRSGSVLGLLFVIGTPRISDLGTAFDMEALKDSKVINIDYKPENQGFGDIPLIGRNSSSVSELIASFLSSLGLKIDVDIASNLMSGIISATDNFQSSSTSALAFETAASLMKKGAVRQVKSSQKQDLVERDSFFTPKAQPSFPKTSKGTEEKKEEPSFIKSSTDAKAMVDKSEGQVDEDNPPDDWLAPKIYKGSTSI
ncbi:MAG: hypothetical protein Q8P26_00075 [Candidatus Levybacteria bacterium]|nr:hypothetical protein [Candidatus Levybacteria bacterium]